MDKSRYEQIKSLIAHNPVLTGFDLFYIGFFSYFVPNLTLEDIFKHISNIISMYNDDLINSEEKVDFLIRILSKKVDLSLLKLLSREVDDVAKENQIILIEYFTKILKILPKFPDAAGFKVFYLGNFQALCPSYPIIDLLKHLANLSVLVKDDLIDEDGEIEFLLKMLNNKIKGVNNKMTHLHIPKIEESDKSSPQKVQAVPVLVQSHEEITKKSDPYIRKDSDQVDSSSIFAYKKKPLVEEHKNKMLPPVDEDWGVPLKIQKDSESSKGLEDKLASMDVKGNDSSNYNPGVLSQKSGKTSAISKSTRVDSIAVSKPTERKLELAREDSDLSADLDNPKPIFAYDDEWSDNRQPIPETEEKKMKTVIEREDSDISADMGNPNPPPMISTVPSDEWVASLPKKSTLETEIEKMKANRANQRRVDEDYESDLSYKSGSSAKKKKVLNTRKELTIANPKTFLKSESDLSYNSDENNKKNLAPDSPDSDLSYKSPVADRNVGNEYSNRVPMEHKMQIENPVNSKDKSKPLSKKEDGNDSDFSHKSPEKGSPKNSDISYNSERKDQKKENENSNKSSKQNNFRFNQFKLDHNQNSNSGKDPFKNNIHSKQKEVPKPQSQNDKTQILEDLLDFDLNEMKKATDQTSEAGRRKINTVPDFSSTIQLEDIPEDPNLYKIDFNKSPKKKEPISSTIDELFDLLDGGVPPQKASAFPDRSYIKKVEPKPGESSSLESKNETQSVDMNAWKKLFDVNNPSKSPIKGVSETQVSDPNFSYIKHFKDLKGQPQVEKKPSVDSDLSAPDSPPRKSEKPSVVKKNNVLEAPTLDDPVHSYASSQSGDSNNKEANKSGDSSKLKRLPTREEEELSMRLIKELEEQDKKDESKRNIAAKDEATCQICLDDLYGEDFKPLERCGDVFHVACMKEYIKSKIDEKGFPIKCPSVECKCEIDQKDVKEFVNRDYLERFVEFSFKSYVEKHGDEVSCCPTPDCQFAFVLAEGQSEFNCEVCKKHYCLNCRVVFHKGMSCKEFEVSNKRDENDIKFEKFVKGKKYKQCPKCNFWVSKTEGCDAMQCRCGTQFCYHCGKPGDGHVCPCRNKYAAGGGGMPMFGAYRGGDTDEEEENADDVGSESLSAADDEYRRFGEYDDEDDEDYMPTKKRKVNSGRGRRASRRGGR